MIFIYIIRNNDSQEYLIVKREAITKCKTIQINNFLALQDEKPTKFNAKLHMDGIFLHFFLQELAVANNYRNYFIDNFYENTNSNTNSIKVYLTPTKREIIDYHWNYRITFLVRQRYELEHTLSWLSTLGGAFSALGDYCISFAETAGKISLNQLYLAFCLGDPNIVAKCRLYLSLSLIQCYRFKLAKQIIYREYVNAKNDSVVDNRLINMCQGIWCKLKYEYEIYKQNKLLR